MCFLDVFRQVVLVLTRDAMALILVDIVMGQQECTLGEGVEMEE
jgi:hypothetical protein